MRFPRHPLFEAAALERVIAAEDLAAARLLLGGTALLFVVLAVATGSAAWLGVALLIFAFFIPVAWCAGFIGYYIGRSITPLPGDIVAWEKIPFEAEWPAYLEFSAAALLTTVGDPDDAHAVLKGIFSSSMGKFFTERTGIAVGDLMDGLGGEVGPRMPVAELARRAAKIAIERKHAAIRPADLLSAIAAADPALQRSLRARDLSPRDLDHISHWLDILAEHHRAPHFVERLLASPGIGKDWHFGFTVFLDSRSEPLGRMREDELHVVTHQNAIRELEEALLRSTSANAILVGPPGVGKLTVIKGFAVRARTGRSRPELNWDRVVRLSMGEILGEQGGNAAATFERIFQDVERAGNLILVIEDLELYVVPGRSTSVADLLLPFFRSPRVHVIGLTTPEGYAAMTTAYPAASSLFHAIQLVEPDEETVMKILADVALVLEGRYGCFVRFQTLKRVYELSKSYLAAEPFPAKAVTLLEEAAIAAAAKGNRELEPEAVEGVLRDKFGAVVGGLDEREKKLLENLEASLHERVIAQDAALNAIADAVRRKRTGVAAGSKPIASFLFLGPTGVGKTETAKALAAIYFGSEDAMIRFDMTEYQNPGDIERLIGSAAAKTIGLLAERVRAKPFSLLLFDEIEKANPNVLNLFLRVLDEGRATDAFGKPIDFTNTFIIATSNAGSELIRESLDAGMDYAALQKKLIDEIFRQNIFRPEFVNRFDAVIAYAPLKLDEVKQVAALMLGKLRARLEEEGYGLSWSDAELAWLAKTGYSATFGARELRRVIQDKIEAPLAKDIIAGKYKKGETIALEPPVPEAPPAEETGV
ncbi:ATP-dependent Clp protease ATP-binding subunit [Candidatus Parcubacteria bacterium]|nr:MAG: ATP-dependent Clp protease ATP-binding subunit [Candidatus Parcubacteria bacterium]